MKPLCTMAMALVFSLSGCATIVNEANIPLSVSFADGSKGRANVISITSVDHGRLRFPHQPL